MSAVVERIRRAASLRPQRLLLAEADDERIVRAAGRLTRERVAQVGVVGSSEVLQSTARRAGVSLAGIETIESGGAAEIARTAAELRASRGEKLSGAAVQVAGPGDPGRRHGAPGLPGRNRARHRHGREPLARSAEIEMAVEIEGVIR